MTTACLALGGFGLYSMHINGRVYLRDIYVHTLHQYYRFGPLQSRVSVGVRKRAHCSGKCLRVRLHPWIAGKCPWQQIEEATLASEDELANYLHREVRYLLES